MSRVVAVAIVPLALTLLGGCGGTPDEGGEDVGTAQQFITTDNALSPNALSPNALSPNALSPNALSPNALSPNSLTALQDTGTNGTLARQLLKYTVGCALDATQSFSFSWNDSDGAQHDETYPGSLGLAPAWASGPLSPDGQRWVSACLAARSNYYGVQVIISLRAGRGILKLDPGSPELGQYAYLEGAFWGNLFTSNPHVYSCFTSANVQHSRAAQRECAAGHFISEGNVLPCPNITPVGPCEYKCDPADPAIGDYPECQDSTFAITTALP